jgi:hypothetical protein
VAIRNPKREELRRLASKTLAAQFKTMIQEGLNCSPFEAEAVLDVAGEVYTPFLDAAGGTAPPGKVTLLAVSADEPAGKAVVDCEKVAVCLSNRYGISDARVTGNSLGKAWFPPEGVLGSLPLLPGLPGHDAGVRSRIGLHGLLKQSVEEHAASFRMPSVEAEGELVEVVRQMLVTDGPLMRAEDPPFQECRDSMDSRHEFVGKLLAALDVCDLVSIPIGAQGVVPGPPIGVDRRTGSDDLLNKGNQAGGGYVMDSCQSDTPDAPPMLLRCDDHDALGLRFSSGHALFGAADVGLIHLDRAAQLIPTGADHRSPQLVQPRPGGAVVNAEDPLETKCADPILLVRDVPHGCEPGRQRRSSQVEDGARRHRHCMPAVRATPQTIASLPGGLTTAPRAGKPVAPTQPFEIGQAVCIVGEPSQEILPPGRVVHASYRVLSHPGRLPDKGSERHTPFG